MKLAVVGLGKLGAPFAALLAAKGNDVVGADLNPEFVERISNGLAPVDETGLGDLLAQASRRIRATTNVEEAAADADIVFIVVPTPSLADATFDTSFVVAAVRSIGQAFAARAAGTSLVVVVTSTVMPGATDGPIREALEESAGTTVGVRLGLCYSPEFIAIGSVIADMRKPDFILIGESSLWAGEKVALVLQAMTDNHAPVRRMSLVDAEVTKIAVNTFVTTKISYANMLGEICARLPGADAAVVARTVGLDSRIGAKYLQPAAKYGGPCFPRDNAALSALARSLGTSAGIAEATDAINERQVSELGEQVLRAAAGRRIAILGLSYKVGTGLAEQSFGVDLAKYLHERGGAPVVYDPKAMPHAMQLLGECATPAARLEDAVAGVSVVVVATPWEAFQGLPQAIGSGIGSGDGATAVQVFDCWRMFDPNTEGLSIVHPGVGPGQAGSVRSADQ
jgi:UDPglucose 6-dehydrogenase